jgi:parvulin-like peptidyl-prolyl isomerase
LLLTQFLATEGDMNTKHLHPLWISLAAVVLLVHCASAEETLPAPRAATVNGAAIPEVALQRALKPVPAEHQAKARQEILRFLIDQLVLDQYLVKQNIPAPKEEVEARLAKVKEEAKKGGREFDVLLKQLMLTEDELRQQLAADLRWENYVKSKTNDKQLAEFFAARREWFDGSQVRARHILVAVEGTADAKTREAARSKVISIQKLVEARVAELTAKLDPKLDELPRQEARLKAASEAFAEAAKDSDCPSKKNGGDLGWFPRVGSMVEPFAKAAFALKPGELTGPIETQFGYHVILCTGKLNGKDVKFDDLKDDVREVYSERLKEELVPELRKTAKIEIATQK